MPLPALAAAILLSSATGEVHCLARNVYHEARGEPELGQVAVAQVTMLRVERRWMGADSVCEAVHQPHQFSWTLGGPKRETDRRAWSRSVTIAWEVYLGVREPAAAEAVSFRESSLPPPKQMVLVRRIGRHSFYRRR